MITSEVEIRTAGLTSPDCEPSGTPVSSRAGGTKVGLNV